MRCADGGARVVDCRLAERIKPRDAEAFAATRAACELVGWRYEVFGSPDPIMMMNVRWLSGYRRPRHDVPAVAAALETAFGAPTALMSGATSAGLSPSARAISLGVRPLRRSSATRSIRSGLGMQFSIA